MSALLPLLEQRDRSDWVAKFREADKKEFDKVIEAETQPTEGEITMGETIAQLNRITGGDAIIVTDVGQHQMIACRYAEFTKTRSSITSGGLGTMEVNVKILLLNNEFLGMVRQWQQMFFEKRYASTVMVNPDFQLLGQAYGIKTKLIDERADLVGALEEMMKHDGAYLLEVRVGKENNVFPMVPSGAATSDIRLE